jgi:FkbH-like protein
METILQSGQQARAELSASKRELLEKRLRGALKPSAPLPAISKRPPDSGPAPLSFIQQQLWFLHQFDPASPAYHIAAALRIEGPLNVQALERGMNRLLERQQSLRAVFPAGESGPVHVIEPFVERKLAAIDLREFVQSERRAHAEQLLKREAKKPFDLGRGPLFRTTLLRLSESEHVLLLVQHHIISDGWSLGVIFRDLEAFYRAEVHQTPVELPELPIQFTDFAAWQEQLGASNAFDNDLQFWRDKLDGAPFLINLPLDHPRPTRPGFRGAVSSILLPRSFMDSMLALGHLHGATSFIFFLTALTILVNKWSAQLDLVLGTVVACRTRREIENLAGCFMNFLPLRMKLEGMQTAMDLLRHVKSTVLEAYVHQDCPFEQMVEAVNPARRLTGNPLYNVALLLQNFPVGVLQTAGLSSNFIPLTTESSLLDLRFIAEEKETAIILHCEYDTDLFARETIVHLLASYRAVLETLVQSPETPLSEFRIADGLTSQAAAARKRQNKKTIAIAGTFTVEPIEESLKYWIQQLEVPAQTRFAPYNQVFQQLLDPAGVIRGNQDGVNVLLLRLEDLKQAADQNGDPAGLDHNVAELIRAFKSALPQVAVPCLICLCPASKAFQGNAELVGLEKQIAQELAKVPNAHVALSSEILELYPVPDYDDPHADRLGHIPYSPTFFHALGTFVARRFHALVRPARKVIVLDCDQTLWTGVCAEDGISGIRCDAPRKALQEFMRAQQDAGMLLAACSKNNEADVLEVFNTCSDMVLRKEHFAAWRVNWEPKSANIRSLANELRLGLDSFIFIDDNPVECAEVEANCPGVLVLQVPQDPAEIPRWLKHLWVFDKLKVTVEDRNRTAMYHQNRLREQLMAESLSMAEFVAGLRLQIKIAPATSGQLPRLAQLTERTNQFNCTTIRRSEAELTQLWRSGTHQLLSISVSDRFGDYGLVGLVIYNLDADAVVVDSFLLSCRVLGKGVEHRMLATLGKIATAAGLGRVDIPFCQTARNQPAWDFLNEVGAAFRQGTNGSTAFRFPADVAARTVFDPQCAEPAAAQPASAIPSSPTEELPGAKFRRFNWITLEASDPEQISRLIAEHRAPTTTHGAANGRPPQNELERQLLDLWRELLHNDAVGITDDFFSLGGTSLLAVRLCAQIEKGLTHKVPLATFFRAPTVEQLARAIERAHSRHERSSLVAIQHKGTRPPLVLVHGAGGGVLWGYANLAAHLGHDQPVYAFEPRHNKSANLLTVEDMAAQYVRDLRAFQPKGPYYLGGYCFGGYVAYEMARCLERDGEQIGLLVLLDSAAPGDYDRVVWWRPGFYPNFVRNCYYWLADSLEKGAADRRDLIARKWAVLKRKVARAFKRQPGNGSEIDLEEYISVSQFPEHELELWKLHLTAGTNYKPREYGGKVLLLRTRGQPLLCSFDPQYGWGKLARGGLEVRIISGAHEKVFIEPDIQELAAELKRALETAQSLNSFVQKET